MTIVDITAHDAHFAGRASDEEWARITAFRARPRFLDGVRRHAGAMQPFFAQSMILNKVVVEAWRFQMLVLTLWLDETYDIHDARSGLTVANLQRLCAQMKIASPGRVFAFIQLMRAGAFLTRAPAGADARVVRFVPTPRFMEIVEEWNTNIFAAIDATAGNTRLADLARAQPDLGRNMRTSGGAALIAGWDAMGPFPEFEFFAGCDGGFLMMEYIVVRAIGDDGHVRAGPVDVDLHRRARDFGGSRSNLTRLLDRALDAGMLAEPHAMGRNVVLTPRTICAFLGFIASFLAFFEEHVGLVEGADSADRVM